MVPHDRLADPNPHRLRSVGGDCVRHGGAAVLTFTAILIAVLSLGAPHDTGTEVAAAIAKYARTPDEAAFLAAWAEHESHYSADIAAGNCKRWQCDAHKLPDGTIEHRARGLFQIHRGAAGADWDQLHGNIDAQVRSAARMVRWAMRECRTPVGAFRRRSGLACDRKLRGEEARVRSFQRARAKL